MSETEEQKERRVVAECMHHLPAEMNEGDGEVLLTILYTTGVLNKYLDDVVRRAKESSEWDDDVSVDEIEFYRYFDFEDDVELDSEGRITVLDIYIKTPSGLYLPPIIERLHKLQHIHLQNCKLIPIELGNLPLLESIEFVHCDQDLFERIPDGLLLSALKQVKIWGFGESCPTLSAWSTFLPNSLEVLQFGNTEREQVDELLCALQNHDFGFRDTLTKIQISHCELNEGDLERLLFDIQPRFPNLHTLVVEYNDIKSLRGIEDRIKQLERISSSSSPPPPQTVIPDNKLRKGDHNRGGPLVGSGANRSGLHTGWHIGRGKLP